MLNRYFLTFLTFCFVSIFSFQQANAQTGSLLGTIIDAQSNEPLTGATIMIEEIGQGASADFDGNFTIENLEVGEYTADVRFVGYRALQTSFTISEGENEVTFELREDLIGLEEVVVTGAGVATERRRLGSTVSSVDASRVETSPISSMQDLLSGRVPGMVQAGGGGAPGEGAAIRIRGSASLSMSNEPVIYIDGVRMDNRASGADQSNHGLQSSPLNDINPDDIERVEILKGAAAATLYGSEANNGVIQVFTKRGSSDDTKFTFNTSQTFYVPKTYDRNYQYNAGTGEIDTINSLNEEHRLGYRQNYNISAQGGSETVNYFSSVAFSDQTGVTPSAGNSNVRLRSNIGFVPNERVNARMNVAYISQSTDYVQLATGATHGFSGNLILAMPSVVSEDRPLGEPFSPMSDNYARENSLERDRVIASANLNYSILDNLNLSGTFGYDWLSDEAVQFVPFGSVLESTGSLANRIATKELVTVDLKLDWSSPIFNDNFSQSTVIGAQSIFDTFNEKTVSVTDFAGAGVTNLSGGATLLSAGESYEEVINAGFFGQNQIEYRDRVYVTTGIRFDGNSAFGENLGLQAYPKISVSYIASGIVDQLDFMTSLRLRAAYGESGLQPGSFDAQRTFLAESILDGVSGIIPNNLGNPDLKPERSKEFELGFETELFDDRLGLDFTYFRSRTTDALLARPYPATQGFLNAQLENIAEVESQGFELRAQTTLHRTQNSQWNINASIAGTYQEVANMGEVAAFKATTRPRPSPYIIEGYQPGAHFGSKLDPDQPYNLSVPIDELNDLGQISGNALRDADGNEAFEFLGNMLPTISGSIQNSYSYGNLDLNVMFDYALDYAKHSGTRQLRSQLRVSEEAANIQRELQDASTSIQRKEELAAQAARLDIGITDNWVSDADFFRLQEVSFSYNAQTEWLEGLGVNRARFTLAGRNLYTWTGYEGFGDPDSGGAASQNFLAGYEYLHLASPSQIHLSLRFEF